MALRKRTKYAECNTLLCILKSLEGKCTSIDLQNESFVTGKIINVDGLMNVELEKVIYHDSNGPKYTFENFFVKSTNIRYVHIPKGLKVEKLVEDYFHKDIKPKPKKTATYKKKRAEQYQANILSSLGKTIKTTD